MANKWRLDLINPTEIVTTAIHKAWAASLADLEQWIAKDLVLALIYGNFGIQGIAETPFYTFISSPKGLSQLGIEKSEPPKLLDAYKNAFKVSRNNRILMLQFGDTARLKMGTPHPASGTGFLQITSWMEWVLDGLTVGRGYVPRAALPGSMHKSIRIKSASGGLMLPDGHFGSTGLWEFPTNLRDYDKKWLSDNSAKIETVIVNQLAILLTKHLT